jgi:hypothetical protein
MAIAIFAYAETPKDICAVNDGICSKSAKVCIDCGDFLVKQFF